MVSRRGAHMGFEWREQPRMHAERHCRLCPDAFFFFFNLFLNWRKFALQCCVGFCHTTTQISRNYTYITSLGSLPPFPCATPLGPRRAPGWPPCVTQQLLASCLSDTRECTHGDAAFCSRPTLSWRRGEGSLCLRLHPLPAQRFISAIFPDSVYMR